MAIKAKCWVNDGSFAGWVRFTLIPGEYSNIILFLEAQKLSFLAEMQLDFTTIPSSLHGKGYSNNLLDYLSFNTDDDILVMNFLMYFLNTLTDMRYVDGGKLNFSFGETTGWQGLTLNINGKTIVYITVDSDLYSCDDNVISCDQTEV